MKKELSIENLCDAVERSTEDYIFICDWDEEMICFSRNAMEEFNLDRKISKTINEILLPLIYSEDRELAEKAFLDLQVKNVDKLDVICRMKRQNNHWEWFCIRGSFIQESENSRYFIGVIMNLKKQGKVDYVTDLLNISALKEHIGRLLEEENTYGSLLLIGLDDFKNVNSLYNYDIGNAVLHSYGRKIKALFPEEIKVFRMNGDEFAIVLPKVNPKEVEKYYKEIQKNFQCQQELDGNKYYCTVSAGCAVYPKDGTDYAALMNCAGYALEDSKSRGKNRISFFYEEMLLEKQRSLEIEELLKESIEDNYRGFEVYYQAQVEALSGQVTGAEALMRWKCEKFGAVSPVEFIPIMERSGLILRTGRWIFREAVRTCAQWCKANSKFTMSINVSFLQLIEEDFIPFMVQTMKEEGVNPNNVIVELTESCIISGSRFLLEMCNRIHSSGVGIAMDDFGTGYSSLEVLKIAPIDMIKVARTFVKGILQNSFDATFLHSIVALCHDRKAVVCLEGVETDEEYLAVNKSRLDIIQGFLFGKPVSKEQFEQSYFQRDGLHKTVIPPENNVAIDFMESYLKKKEISDLLDKVTDDVMAVGLKADEVLYGKEQVGNFMRIHFKEWKFPVEYNWLEQKQKRVMEGGFAFQGRLKVDTAGQEWELHITAFSILEALHHKISVLHISKK